LVHSHSSVLNNFENRKEKDALSSDVQDPFISFTNFYETPL